MVRSWLARLKKLQCTPWVHYRQIVAIILLSSLSFQSIAFAFPPPNDPVAEAESISSQQESLEPEINEEELPADARRALSELRSLVQFDPDVKVTSEREAIRKEFQANERRIMHETWDLVDRLGEFLESKATTFGERKKLYKQLKAGDVRSLAVVVPGVGKAEPTLIEDKNGNTRLCAKVVPEVWPASILVVPSDLADEGSPHLLKWIGRQHLEADSYYGRSVLLMSLLSDDRRSPHGNFESPSDHLKALPEKEAVKRSDNFTVDKLVLIPKFKWSEAKYWKYWWAATKQTPNEADIRFGIANGVFQAAVTAGLATLANQADPSIHVPKAIPSAILLGYGSIFGVFISTYKNWENRGWAGWDERTVRWLKSMLNSSAFAYGFVGLTTALTQGIAAAGSPTGFHVTDLTGALVSSGVAMASVNHLNVGVNILLNNRAKIAATEIPLTREKEGKNRRIMKPKNLLMKLIFKGVKQQNAERQAAYYITWVPRQFDYLVSFFAAGSLAWQVPAYGRLTVGLMMLWATIPIMGGLDWMHARYSGSSREAELKEAFLKTVRVHKYPHRVLEAVKTAGKIAWTGTRNAWGFVRAKCETLFKPQDIAPRE